MTYFFRALALVGISLLLASCGSADTIDPSNGNGTVTDHDATLPTPTPIPTAVPTAIATQIPQSAQQQAANALLAADAALKTCTMDSDCEQMENVLSVPSLCWWPLYNKTKSLTTFQTAIHSYEEQYGQTVDCGMKICNAVTCKNNLCSGGCYFD